MSHVNVSLPVGPGGGCDSGGGVGVAGLQDGVHKQQLLTSKVSRRGFKPGSV